MPVAQGDGSDRPRGTEAIVRCRRYARPWYRGEYFVTRGLQKFIESALIDLLQSGASVCDVGCGEQPFRTLIEGRGSKYLGVDIAQNQQGTVDVIAPATRLPFAEGSFEVVLCSEVLEHIETPEVAFGEMVRIVAPGGTLVLTSPFLYPLHEEPYDYGRVTPHQLVRWAAATGLEATRNERNGNELHVLATIWSNAWSRSVWPRNRYLRGCWLAITHATGNIGAILANRVVGFAMPQKCFLNCMFVARKALA